MPPQYLDVIPEKSGVALSWSPSTAGSGVTFQPGMNYTVYRGTTPGGELPIATVTNMSNPPSNKASWNDTTATPGTYYYYKVRGVNNGLTSNWSNEAHVIAGAPTEPWNIAAMAKDGKVSLSWYTPRYDGGSPILRYAIYRGTSPGSETFHTTTTNGGYFNDMNVTGNRTYYYTICAVNAVGEGLMSAEVLATVPAAPDTTPTTVAVVVASVGMAIGILGVGLVMRSRRLRLARGRAFPDAT